MLLGRALLQAAAVRQWDALLKGYGESFSGKFVLNTRMWDKQCALATPHRRHDTSRAACGQGAPIIHKFNAVWLVCSRRRAFLAFS
jgi:hypothetical protein